MSKTAMIVDDSLSIRRLVSATLTRAGFSVIEGANGKDALDKLAGKSLSVIVTDLNMPVMDGLQFIREVRGNPSHRFTPILFLTTETDGTKKEAARQAGATAWLQKPFNPAQMLQVIGKVVP